MEVIINLDDSLAKCSEPQESFEMPSPFKRRKNRKKKKRKIEVKQSVVDLDATLNPGTSSLDITEETSGIENSVNNKKRKRKKSSVIIVDSEDDCKIIDTSESANDNDPISDVLCISDNSIVELSDSENEPDIVEARKELSVISGSKITKQLGRASKNDCILSCETIKKRKIIFRQVFQNKIQDEECNAPCDEPGTSGGVITPLINNLHESNKFSRKSICYQPLDTLVCREGLRPIVIDGSNVAFGHGKERFSAKGIEICISYFLRRNHKDIHAFIPQFRRRHPSTVGFHILDKMEKDGHLIYTPSRKVDGRRVTSYDDRYIVEYATKTGGIIITRDNYQDLLVENKAWSDTINFRLLPYTFVGDMIMFPQDPLGRGGPTLDKFLTF